jgi:glycosyltransferase involved in cell wall biosynthesis
MVEFSVVIPVYNGEQYIGAAIESVLKQTHPAFNILVLESCSDDSTMSIIESYRDPRISIFAAPSRLGIEDNWKRILNLDLLPYMTILGQDDLLYPEFLQEMAALIEAEPEASLYHTHFHFIDAEGKLVRPSRPTPYRETADEFLRALHLSRRDSRATGFVMRSADYRRIGGFGAFPGLMYAADVAWYRLAGISYKVCSPRYLFSFRVHEQSASHAVSLYGLYEASQQYLEFLANSDYNKSPTNAALARQYVESTFHGQYHRILVGLIASADPERLKAYQEVNTRLLADAARDRLFPVYDLPSRLYEAVARLPYPLRALPLRIILGVRRIRRYIRERSLQASSARR